ncbi:transposase, partial [Xanthomonas oryzae pv. oryzae]
MAHTQNADFFRQPLAEMIDPRHPLAVLARRLPWAQIEAVFAPPFPPQGRASPAGAPPHLFAPSGPVASVR